MDEVTDVDAVIATSRSWADEIAALRTVLLDAGLDETIRWGKACYAHDGANVAIVQEFRDHLALMFFKGVLVDDPEGVLEEQGPNSHAARRVRFTSVEDVTRSAGTVGALLRSAVAVEEAGTPLPPRPETPLAVELQQALDGDAALAAAFAALTPGRRREYDLHVTGAKQAATRQRRVEAIVPRIMAGRGMRDR